MDSTSYSADAEDQADRLSHDDEVVQEVAELIVQVTLGTTSNLFLEISAFN